MIRTSSRKYKFSTNLQRSLPVYLNYYTHPRITYIASLFDFSFTSGLVHLPQFIITISRNTNWIFIAKLQYNLTVAGVEWYKTVREEIYRFSTWTSRPQLPFLQPADVESGRVPGSTRYG